MPPFAPFLALLTAGSSLLARLLALRFASFLPAAFSPSAFLAFLAPLLVLGTRRLLLPLAELLGSPLPSRLGRPGLPDVLLFAFLARGTRFPGLLGRRGLLGRGARGLLRPLPGRLILRVRLWLLDRLLPALRTLVGLLLRGLPLVLPLLPLGLLLLLGLLGPVHRLLGPLHGLPRGLLEPLRGVLRSLLGPPRELVLWLLEPLLRLLLTVRLLPLLPLGLFLEPPLVLEAPLASRLPFLEFSLGLRLVLPTLLALLAPLVSPARWLLLPLRQLGSLPGLSLEPLVTALLVLLGLLRRPPLRLLLDSVGALLGAVLALLALLSGRLELPLPGLLPGASLLGGLFLPASLLPSIDRSIGLRFLWISSVHLSCPLAVASLSTLLRRSPTAGPGIGATFESSRRFACPRQADRGKTHESVSYSAHSYHGRTVGVGDRRETVELPGLRERYGMEAGGGRR